MKRYIASSVITFLTAFFVYFLTVVDSVTLESFTDGSLVAILFVAARAGVKALMEFFLVATATKS